MAEFEQIPRCCGIGELGYVRDDQDPIESLMSIDYYDMKAHVVFSVPSRLKRDWNKGHALADYIVANKLGTIIETPPARNPGHSGKLKAWVWTPNKTAFKRWQAKIKKRQPEKYGEEGSFFRKPYTITWGNGPW